MKSLCRTSLPANGYEEVYKIDLVNNRKELLTVNILSLALLFGMAALGFLVLETYRMSAAKSFLLVIMIFLCIPAHELIHGAVMKLFSAEKLRFGWHLAYAYCGSEEGVFTKGEYMAIALAPLVTFGVSLSILQVLTPAISTVLFLTNMVNVSGSAGDIYVVWRMLTERRMDILINDTGTDMRIYGKHLS